MRQFNVVGGNGVKLRPRRHISPKGRRIMDAKKRAMQLIAKGVLCPVHYEKTLTHFRRVHNGVQFANYLFAFCDSSIEAHAKGEVSRPPFPKYGEKV